MPEVAKVTLDTNILQEYWKKQDKVRVVEKLLNLAENGELDLAITTRVSADIPHPPLSHRINQLPELRVQQIGAPARWNVSRWDEDYFADPEFSAFLDSLVYEDENEGRKKLPDWRDQDHIQGHYLAKRNVFLTWDTPLLAWAQKLKEKFGVVLMSPEDFLDDLEEV